MKFCTAINCMDGRVQLPVIAYLKQRFNAEFVDVVTEPGPNGILAGSQRPELVRSILDRVRISVERHGSRAVAIVGHHDCAGNPGDSDHQETDVRQAMETLRETFPRVEIIGLTLNENWAVQELADPVQV